ncbi:ATP-binding protein [Actinokineospora enzanensis]|uniref:ATP-binding protein n=1 Tax=Actinokineospora enzanensis TaxID=155975 RepID=UPI00039B7C84|nr:tetratricopeptide repeat protein [Actinokineospora enzanensis]
MPPGEDDEVPRSDVSGSAHEVIQARDIHGGVHLYDARTPDRPIPRQLPGDVSGFVNRVAELRRLDAVLADRASVAGLYVITGTAGVGKTSLALHWAHSVRRHFPDGQLYVNLRGYDPGPPVGPEQALEQFLRALGVPPARVPTGLHDRSALFRSLLADRHVLVVLDNAATVSQVRPLLPGNAECLVLVTSRSRFSALVAREGAHRLALDMLTEEEAVRLLRTVTVGYRVGDDVADLAELARLCARLPLALRIAAERASSRPLMRLRELIDDLRDESALWDALSADEGDEEDAVRSVFAWSYRALPETAARLFRLLGLHPGPEFGVAAAAVLAGIGTAQARQLLDVLVGAHVLEQHAPGRFQFHDLLRHYAADQAAQHEDEESRRAALSRILTWYTHSAASAVALLAPLDRPTPLGSSTVIPAEFTDRDQAADWYETEVANLVAAVRVAATNGMDAIAWRIPAIMRSVQVIRNPFEQWFEVAGIGLEAALRSADLRGQAEMLDSLGKANLQSHRLDRAEECHVRALGVRREIGDRFGELVAINALGLLDWRRRRLVAARERFVTGMGVVAELGERRWEALLLTNVGIAHYELAELGEAREALTRAVELCRLVGDRAYEGNALAYLAKVERELGDHAAALGTIRSALAIAEEDGMGAWEAFWLVELGNVQRALGMAGESLIAYQHSAVVQRNLGDRAREAAALDGTGEAYRELERPEEAAEFHRLAIAICREVGDRWALANALAHLAEALVLVEETAQAATARAEAMRIATDFDDPRAAALVQRLWEA